MTTVLVVHGRPQARQFAAHPHRLDGLGIPAPDFSHVQSLRGRLARRFGGRTGKTLGQNRQGDENESADESSGTDPKVEQEAHAEIKRHPRQIEQRPWATAGQECAHLIQVAHGLQALPGDREVNEAARTARNTLEVIASSSAPPILSRRRPRRISKMPWKKNSTTTSRVMPIRVGTLRLGRTRS